MVSANASLRVTYVSGFVLGSELEERRVGSKLKAKPEA